MARRDEFESETDEHTRSTPEHRKTVPFPSYTPVETLIMKESTRSMGRAVDGLVEYKGLVRGRRTVLEGGGSNEAREGRDRDEIEDQNGRAVSERAVGRGDGDSPSTAGVGGVVG
ncbi:hypothetical protein C8J57DRAFT_1480869 [Mycena rebaudengoi]|nr:hypothetical protein C8J57DRAFT_1480869 [Mycena rebaudengoi]